MNGGLVELVDAWVDDRRARSRRGLSPASERAYRSDLAGLARRIADAHGRAHPDPPDGDDTAGPNAATNHQLARITVADLTEDNLAAVASALVADGYAASTRARMLSAWRGLYRWLVRHGHLTSDPALGFETPAASSQLPVAFSDAELARVLEAAATPDPDSTAAWPTRDVVLIQLPAITTAPWHAFSSHRPEADQSPSQRRTPSRATAPPRGVFLTGRQLILPSAGRNSRCPSGR